ncbi:MAG: amino acid ABC transporter permease [Clostridiales bacterium]|nr:amino acid ABC transporter permease [Clostridiales bacterium]
MERLKDEFILNFVEDDRWRYLVDGLRATIIITFSALIIGIVIGLVVATVRSTHDKTIETMHPGIGRTILKILNFICKLYVTVIRGVPVVVQLLIAYFIIFVSVTNGVVVGILTFGINSGAYVAEIFRGGIMAVDPGQMEAGRSLGFNYVQTMRYIVVPQAFKHILPALLNELIALFKETAVVGYVAVKDLTKGADIIRGRTFSPFMPLFGAALIYLVFVMFFSWIVGKLERRLRTSER